MTQDTAVEETFQDSSGSGYIISGAVKSIIEKLKLREGGKRKELSYFASDTIAAAFIEHHNVMWRDLKREQKSAMSVDDPTRSVETIQSLIDGLGYSIGTHHNYAAGSTNPSDVIAYVSKRTPRLVQLRKPLREWLCKTLDESYDQDTVDDLIECLVRAEVQSMIQSGVITETSDERGKMWTISEAILHRRITPNPAFSS